MIVVDASETRRTSRLPEIEGAVLSDCLEAETGADVMVSLKRFPASNPVLIRRHVESGAILIQLKFGSDLISSITDERINIALGRMIVAGTTHQYQRVILGCGLYLPDLSTGKTLCGTVVNQSAGRVRIKWRSSEPEIDYRALASARRRIAMRGGTFSNLTCEEELIGELFAMESDLAFLASQGRKELLHLPQFPPDPPDPTDPLQVPIEVKDARVVIAAFRGIGPKRTNDLWEALREHNTSVMWENDWSDEEREPTLTQAFSWMMEWRRDWVTPKKVKGWGKGTIQNVREQMGLLPGQDFCVRNTEIMEEE